MRSLTVNTYLVDEDGNYILTETGDRIILGTGLELEYDETFSGLAGSVAKVPHLFSFDVLWSETQSEWRLFVNKQRLIGRYRTRPQALGVLVGMFRRLGNNSDDSLIEVISHLLSTGSDVMEDATPIHQALYSLGTSDTPEPDIYYRLPLSAENDGTAPDYVMSEALAVMGGNTKLLTLYPDTPASGVTPTWKNFNVLTWDGVTALPVMDVAEYVAMVENALTTNQIASAEGVTFMIDWESGTINTQRDAMLYWNDTANPQFRTALIELRSQLQAIYDRLKSDYPDSYFGMYGGIHDFPNGNLKFDASGELAASGSTSRSRLGNCTQAQIDKVTEAHTAAHAATAMTWDYNSSIAYDYFGADAVAIEEATTYTNGSSLRPSYRKIDLDWSFSLMKTLQPEIPALAIISPSNVASSFDGNVPAPTNKYGWAAPADWVDITINQITEADGYIIWDGLRIDQQKNFFQRYNDWAQVLSIGTDATLTSWWSLMQDMENQFNFLTDFGSLHSVAAPTTPEEWFDVPRATRELDSSLNLFVKPLTESLRDDLLPLIESWRSTGVLPYVKRSASTITGTVEIGQTLTAAAFYAGDGEVDYRWRNSAGTTDLGTNSTYVVQASDAGETIECRVRVRLNGVTLDDTTITTAAVPVPAPTQISNDFGNPAFGQITLGVLDVAKITTGTLTVAATGTAVNGSPLNWPLTGTVASEFLITTSSVLTFTFPDTTEISVSPTSLSDGQMQLPAGAFVTKVAGSTTGDVVTLEVTP